MSGAEWLGTDVVKANTFNVTQSGIWLLGYLLYRWNAFLKATERTLMKGVWCPFQQVEVVNRVFFTTMMTSVHTNVRQDTSKIGWRKDYFFQIWCGFQEYYCHSLGSSEGWWLTKFYQTYRTRCMGKLGLYSWSFHINMPTDNLLMFTRCLCMVKSAVWDGVS